MWVLTHINDYNVLAFLEIHNCSDASVQNHGQRPIHAMSAGWQESTLPWPENSGQLICKPKKCDFFLFRSSVTRRFVCN